MAIKRANRVHETTQTTGTGTYSLDGALGDSQTFVSGVGNGNKCYYSAFDGTDWEVGQGTVTNASPDTLSRDVIFESSNSNNKVSWPGSGVRDIILCTPAGKQIEEDDEGDINISGQIVLGAPKGTVGSAASEILRAGSPSSDFLITSQNGDGRAHIAWNADYDAAQSRWESIVGSEGHSRIGFEDGAPGRVTLATASSNASAGDPITWNFARLESNGDFRVFDGNFIQSETGKPVNAQAWIRFNQTNHTIQNDYNVSSIVDNGVGDTTINFTDAMANTSYSVVASGTNVETVYGLLAGSVSIFTLNRDGSGAVADSATVCVAVFGEKTL